MQLSNVHIRRSLTRLYNQLLVPDMCRWRHLSQGLQPTFHGVLCIRKHKYWLCRIKIIIIPLSIRNLHHCRSYLVTQTLCCVTASLVTREKKKKLEGLEVVTQKSDTVMEKCACKLFVKW